MPCMQIHNVTSYVEHASGIDSRKKTISPEICPIYIIRVI